jgi:hypothetical protein
MDAGQKELLNVYADQEDRKMKSVLISIRPKWCYVEEVKDNG